MNDFEVEINKSINNYLEFGSRSNKKLIPLHSYIANYIGSKTIYTINSLPDKEKLVIGKYYNKKVDICINDNTKTLGVISVKFIMSNYLQNSNNYFESLIGEIINLKKVGLIQWFILIIFDDIPYFDKNGNTKYYEKFTNFDRYKHLVDDNILDFLTIIILYNGKSLVHPTKCSSTEVEYKIIKQFPDTFCNVSSNFIKKINDTSK
jgi:hypothetical protein